jgi:hypothetical protein
MADVSYPARKHAPPGEELECHICLQPLNGRHHYSLKCCRKHTAYHLQCIRSWLRIQNRCPHCRCRSSLVMVRHYTGTSPGTFWFGLALAAWFFWHS